MIERETIVRCARGWLGTPYHHQASMKSVGCDCLGLIRGLWPGDVLVFRMRDRGVAKHAGILVSALPASGLLDRDEFALPASPRAIAPRFSA